jgi:2-polyprenyl-3-methyl-5-hydroxy-6-metoxy-1,4-benzoquinol methylase
MGCSTTNDVTGSEYWDRWWRSQPIPIPLQPHWPEFGKRGYFLRAVERHTGPLNGKSVVELGGAMSLSLLAMVKWRGVKATSIDYSPASVAPTKRMFADNGSEVECIADDFFSPAIQGRCFDLVTHWGVLEHQRDPAPLIELSTRLCAPNGKVIFSMPQMKGPGAWSWKRQAPENWGYHIYHSDHEILRALARAGFHAKRVFWGLPFLQMNGLPLTGQWQKVAAKVQWCLYQADRYGFSPYNYGLPYLSYVRGFVAERVTSRSN